MKKLIRDMLIVSAALTTILPIAEAVPIDCVTFSNLPPPAGTVCEAPVGGGSGKQTTTRWYAGLVWELGGNQGLTPDIVLGVRTLTVKDIDSVSGGDANLRFKIKDSVSLDSVRLAYVGGKPSVLGNAGLGYSFTHSTPIATAALEGSYVRLSTDYLLAQNKFQFFGEINTLKKPDTVGNGQVSCPSPFKLADPSTASQNILQGFVISVPSSVIVNGQTCYKPASVT